MLACAIAHELGHLLLPTAGHSDLGLMRAWWDRDDFGRAERGQLRFSAEEAALLRGRDGDYNRLLKASAATTLAINSTSTIKVSVVNIQSRCADVLRDRHHHTRHRRREQHDDAGVKQPRGDSSPRRG